MLLEESTFQQEIDYVLLSGPKPVQAYWEGEIIVTHEDDEEVRIVPARIQSIDIDRDYQKKFSDDTIICALFAHGDHIREIYPNRERLQMELYEYPVPEGHEGYDDDDREAIKRTYRAVLQETNDQNIEANTRNDIEVKDANHSVFDQLHLQLFPVAVEQLRMTSVGGIYADASGGDVARHVMKNASDSVDVADEDKIVGVDMVDSDNQKKHPQIVIPHGTKVEDVPNFVQQDGGGVYSTGMGCYTQDNMWYMYPQYNTKRFDKEKRVVQIFNVPNDKYESLERTYRLDEYQVIILATGEVGHSDTSQTEQMNKGNGVKFQHSDKFYGGQTDYEDENLGKSGKDNKFVMTSSDNNTAMVLKDKPGQNYAPVAEGGQSNNVFAETSKVASRLGGKLILVWEFSRPDLIFPNMPVKFYYLEGEDIMEAEGTVIHAHHYIHDPNIGPVAKNFRTNSTLTLFLGK